MGLPARGPRFAVAPLRSAGVPTGVRARITRRGRPRRQPTGKAPLARLRAGVEYHHFAGNVKLANHPLAEQSEAGRIVGSCSLGVFAAIMLALDKLAAAPSNLSTPRFGVGLPDGIVRLTSITRPSIVYALTVLPSLRVTLPLGLAARTAPDRLLG